MANRVLIGGLLAVIGVGAWVLVLTHKAAAPALDHFLAQLPPGVVVTHGAVNYNSLTSQLRVDDVRVRRAGAKGFLAARVVIDAAVLSAAPARLKHVHIEDVRSDDGVAEIKSVDVDGVDVAGLRDIFDPASYPDGHPAWTDSRVVIGKFDARGISVRGGAAPNNGVFTQDELLIANLTMHPLPAPPDYSAEAQQHQPFSQRFVSTMGVDILKLDKISVKTTGDMDNGLALQMGLDKFLLKDARAGKIGTYRIDNLSADGKKPDSQLAFHFGLEHFSVLNADFHTLAAIDFSLDDVRNQRAMIAKFAPAMRDAFIGHMEIKNFAVHVDLRTGGDVDFGLESLDGDSTRDGVNGVRHQTSAMRALTLSGHGLPPAAQRTISLFGIDRLVVDANGDGDYDPLTQRSTLNQVDYNIHDLARVRASGVFTGAAAAGMNPGSPFAGVTLENAKLVYEDHSLVNRMIHVAAASTGEADSVVRERLIARVHASSTPHYDQSDNALQLIAVQIENFIENPGRLTITLAPAMPVDLGTLGNLPVNERLGRLGLSVVAGPITESATLISP